MGRCPWHGVLCNCGLGWPWPENGKMPQRCKEHAPGYDPLDDDIEYTITRKGEDRLRKTDRK